MHKISFKLLIFISFLVIFFVPVSITKLIFHKVIDNNSQFDDITYERNEWIEENVLDMGGKVFLEEDWRERLIHKAEEDKVELFIINQAGEITYTKGIVGSRNALIDKKEDQTTGVRYEQYDFGGFDQYNIYAEDTLIASVYISYPISDQAVLNNHPNYDLAILTGIITIVAGLIIIFFHKNLIKPLYALNRSSQQISNENYHVTLPASRIKEVNNSTEAFMKMAQKLELSKQKNKQLEEERKLFVSSIVHDLRTPIFSLRGFLEGLQKGIITKEKKKIQYVEMSLKQADHLNELVSSLADYSKIEGQIKLEKITTFTIPDIIADVKELLYYSLSEKNIMVEVNNVTNKQISGDFSLLKRAFENILVNSIRHSPENGRIEVVIKEDKGYVETVIVDNGEGFVESELDYVFKPLYRGESARSGPNQRMGLGLTITHVIIQKHEGIIEATNDKKKGAKVIVRIPINCPA
ncbi:hypothetical protein C2I17_21795 [Niallia circulans]|uniref:sensor histidine kinase n=1 Tax=Niallia circulans TaxID=1397 RepID=UPI00201E62DF|nr:HAMP domain-containing sensor histidine kinase [Niallia circulans]UQZ76965.1 hypothetical protein C2I17_21795 [Niallia circulans]